MSWPRSGHGLLVRILKAAIGEGFGYCEFYGPSGRRDGSCCGGFPCRNPAVHMTKQHDRDGVAELAADAPLVVQYRAFVPSVVSHFEYALSRGDVADTAAGFRAFALARVPPWRRFRAKWIDRPRSNRVVVLYEALTADPAATLPPVLALLGATDAAAAVPGAVAAAHGITYAGGERIVSRRLGVRDTRDVATFRHGDRALFAELAALAQGGTRGSAPG